MDWRWFVAGIAGWVVSMLVERFRTRRRKWTVTARRLDDGLVEIDVEGPGAPWQNTDAMLAVGRAVKATYAEEHHGNGMPSNRRKPRGKRPGWARPRSRTVPVDGGEAGDPGDRGAGGRDDP